MGERCADDFEEVGDTFDFDDEPISPTGWIAPSGSVYREYHGEDFSQYLNDDDEHHRGTRYGWETWQMENPGRLDDGTNSKRRRPKSAAIIREKLERLLSSGGSSGKSRNSVMTSQPQNLSRIHDVSFADCKMGNAITVETPRRPESDCRSRLSLETESDLRLQTATASGYMDAVRRQEARSSSTSAVSLCDRPNSIGANCRSDMEEQLDRIENRRGSEAELCRSQQRVASDSDRSTSDGGKRMFRKIHNTLNRRKSAHLKQMSYSVDHEDIRL